ncbi:host specificity protein J [Psychrobacter sp. T6-6]|uniref:host specificity protein J n=1 Tax=Psychrobacter sp. T6-6 TaxID=3457452 RepID=UPI003FD40C7A
MSLSVIKGAKAGQEKPHQPSIAKDDVASISKIKIIYALSDGEVKGLADGAASIMLDGTPLIGADGTPNFDNVEWEIRHGTVDQTHIAGLPNLSSEIAIGTILRSGTPWIRTITNTLLSSTNINVSWSRLSETTDKNDIIGTTVDYAIDVQTDGHGYVTVLDTRIKAKTSGRYQRTHNVKLPEATQGWQIRVRKITADGDNEQTFNQMQIDSIAEIIDAKLRYPHTALLYLSFDARTFSNMPKVSVDMFGRYLKVPSNYDAETRTSTGLWDGTFKTAYTNNPAWVYYDLITNDRYGLGDRLKPFMINKWAIAHIARVCDEPVDDGKGGTEPRFTCNLYLQVDEQAYQVLQHIAGIFRGMSFWDGSQIVLDADTPRDADYVITRANVVGGAFNKSGTSIDDRHTLVQVAWSNPDNNYETDYVTVRNERAIAKYGINPLDMPAVGCTSEGQAYRHGLAALLSEQNRTQTVNFAMGLDGQLPTVGSRVDIADMMFTGANNGGRISAVSADRTIITVDRDDIPATTGDRLTVNLESGRAQTREILSVSGRNITVKAEFDPVAAENVWAIDSDELPTMPFIVLSITENEDRTQYSYTALQYDGTLQAQIDNGTIIEPTPPAPPFNPYIIQAPESVAVASRHREVQAQTVTTLVITWDQVNDAVAYDVEWRKDDGDWIKLPRTGNISVDIDGVYSGNYLARVRAVSAFDALSKPTKSTLTAITGKAGKPPVLANLKVTGLLFGMRLDWAFSAGSGDTAYTEIQVGSAPDVNVTALGQFAYSTDTHTVNGLQGNLSQSYRARIVDKLGNTSDWSAWVTGTTDASADKVMDLIQGQIDESSLNESLTSKIGKISENEDAIGQETEDRIQAIIDTKKKADDAQLAATNAAQLAGNKGEVIYQWQTPAAARQLAQNLWIDTNGGKNTPKRWDGNAWVAVTDKAALDAQAAANAAQQTANDALGKANNANDSIITILDEQAEINNELGLQYESLQGVIADYKPRYADATKYADASRSVQWTYWKTVARDNYAANERITNLQSEVADSNAQLVQRLETEATATSAIASEVTTLEATVGDNTATLQETKQVVDGISSEYTLKLDIAGKIVGFGLVNNAGQPSDFSIRADKFSIAPPANGVDNPSSPFMVLTTPQTIDGITVPAGTYMRNTYIAKSSIDLAQINTASIQSLSSLSATIGHFKSADTGARLEIKDSLLSVYDDNNVLRVRLGLW